MSHTRSANQDNGARMIRTDAPGVSKPINQVQIGSAQGRGSSGGPWITNFGAGFTSADPPGTHATGNTVLGTTSWGFTDNTVKIQGASRFDVNTIYTTTPDIVSLVDVGCNGLAAAVRPTVCQ